MAYPFRDKPDECRRIQMFCRNGSLVGPCDPSRSNFMILIIVFVFSGLCLMCEWILRQNSYPYRFILYFVQRLLLNISSFQDEQMNRRIQMFVKWKLVSNLTRWGPNFILSVIECFYFLDDAWWGEIACKGIVRTFRVRPLFCSTLMQIFHHSGWTRWIQRDSNVYRNGSWLVVRPQRDRAHDIDYSVFIFRMMFDVWWILRQGILYPMGRTLFCSSVWCKYLILRDEQDESEGFKYFMKRSWLVVRPQRDQFYDIGL